MKASSEQKTLAVTLLSLVVVVYGSAALLFWAVSAMPH